MGKRILNRKDLRADYDAAERRKGDDEEVAEDEVAEDEDEEEEEKGEAAEGDEEEEAAEGDDDEEAVVAPVKKKKAAKPKTAKPKSRSRAAKVVRMRVVWGVFNNSHQCIATYEYPKRADADAHAAKLMADKKTTHFVQPVKEAIEEKKEKA